MSSWDGGGSDNDWSTGENWLDDAAPSPGVFTDIIFTGNIRLAPSADQPWNIQSLEFDPAAAAFTLGGSQLTIHAGGITNSSTAIQTISNDIVLAASQVWSDTTSAGPLTLNGDVNTNGHSLTIDHNDFGSGDAVILGGAISGSGSLTIGGGNNSISVRNVLMSGSVANLYSGTTTVLKGILRLDKSVVDGAIAGDFVIGNTNGTGDAGLDDSTIVRLEANDQISATVGNVVSLANDGLLDLNGFSDTIRGLNFTGSGGTVMTGSGTLGILGDITTTAGTGLFDANTIIGNLDLMGGTRTFSTIDKPISVNGVISNGGVTKSGDSSLTYFGVEANSYTGLTTVDEGTLRLDKTFFDGSIRGDLTIGNAIDAPGTAVVHLEEDQQIFATSGNVVTINESGMLDLNGHLETIQELTMQGGEVMGGFGSTLGVLGNVTSLASLSTGQITTNLNLTGGMRTIDVADGAAAVDLQIDGMITAGSLVKTGSGTLRISGKNTTPTTMVDGTLELEGVLSNDLILGNDTDPPSTAVVRLLSDDRIVLSEVTTATIHESGLLDLNGQTQYFDNLTIIGGAVAGGTLRMGDITTEASAQTASISGEIRFFTPGLGGGARTFDVADGAAAIDLEIDATITEFEPMDSLRKQGAGTLLLSGSTVNTTVGTSVLEGTLILETDVPDGGASGLSISSGAVVRLNAAEQIIGGASVSGLLDLNGFSETLSFVGIGSGGSITTGAGTLTITDLALTTTTGSIAGNLDLGAPSVTFNVFDETTDNIDVSAAISGGGLVKIGVGQLTLGGSTANSYTGTTTVSGGTLLLSKTVVDGAIPGELFVQDGAAVRLTTDEQIAAAGNTVTIENTGQLDMAGFSETISNLTLSGAALDTGASVLTVNNQVAANASGTSSSILGNLALGGAITLVNVADGAAGNDLVIDAVVSESTPGASFVKTGDGQLRLLGGPNTFTGSTLVTRGSLVLAGAASIDTVPGDLEIGSVSPTVAATLQLENDEQIDDTAGRTVTIRNRGQLDLNGFSETIRDLTFQGGFAGHDNVRTGAGTLSVLGTVNSLPAAATAVIAGNLDIVSGVQSFDVAEGAANIDLDVAATIMTNSLTKTGAGALRLSAANSYTGGTIVSQGTLLASNATGSATGSGMVIVQNTGLLGGTGSVAGGVTVESGGAVAPGESAGTLTVDSIDFQSGSSFSVEVGGTAPGSGHDVLSVTNAAMLGGSIDVLLINNFVDTITNSDTFSVLNAGALSGVFSSAANGQRVNTADASGSFLINYGPNSAFGADDVVLSNFLLPAQTAVWLGGTDNWFTASKWDINQAPMNSGIAVFNAEIPSGIVTLDQNVAILNLDLGTQAAASLDGSGNLTVADLTWLGTGGIRGAGDLIVNGTMTIGDGGVNILDREIFVAGTLNWLSGRTQGSGAIHIQPGAVANLIKTSQFGFGNLTPIDNAGEIVVNNPTGPGPLFRLSGQMTNSGSIHIVEGILSIEGGGSTSGTIQIDGEKLAVKGGTPLVVTGDITGSGPLEISNGRVNFENSTGSSVGRLDLVAGGTLGGSRNVTIGELNWNGASDLQGPGATTVTGIMTIGDFSSNILNREIFVEGMLNWLNGRTQGSGAIHIQSGAMANLIQSHQFNFGDTTIINNAGTIVVDNPTGAGPLFRFADTFNNSGVVQVVEGSLSLESTVIQHVGSTLTGGTWEVNDGAMLAITTGSNIATNQGAVIFRGPTSVFDKINTLTDNQGRFEIHEGRDFTATAALANGGTIIVGTGSTLDVSAGGLTSTTGRLGGTGTIVGSTDISNVTGGATLAPGLSAGTLTTGDLNFGDGATYEWELDALDASDTVVVDGTLTFGSTATIALVDLGGTPDPLAEYTLFSYTGADPSNAIWTFDALAASSWDISGVSIFVDGTTNRVVLTGLAVSPFTADFDNDGDVDGDDLAQWVGDFGGTGSDADNDGDSDGADFLSWQQQFTGNLNPISASTTVPEPSTLVLLIGLAALGILARRRECAF
ncbi:autotransporter-associated beta strand repeat-containing protein [Pirellulales bacterium]|nr:autotransporter-associated beta strand repeat-containing protein [Pirellulales bacterium]